MKYNLLNKLQIYILILICFISSIISGNGAISIPSSVTISTASVFETDYIKLTLNSSGQATSLYEKSTSTEWLNSSTYAISTIVQNGTSYSSSGLTYSNGTWVVTYGASGVSALYKIIPNTNYITFQLLKLINGNSVTQMNICQFYVKCNSNLGNTYQGIAWNNNFAVATIGLSDTVNNLTASGGYVMSQIYSAIGIVNQSTAVIGTHPTNMLTLIRKLELDMGLPSPMLYGTWNKIANERKSSYLFCLDLTKANVNTVIGYAQAAKTDYIMPNVYTWAQRLGTYPINTTYYPAGETDLKYVIDTIHAAGLKFGLHILTALISYGDTTLVPTKCYKDAIFTLASDITASDTTITVNETIVTTSSGTHIIIDNEGITYTSKSGNQFLGCTRGFGSTTPAIHKAGTKVGKMFESSGRFLVDLEHPEYRKIIVDRIVYLVNKYNIDMIYCDGGEIGAAVGPYYYWVSKLQSDIFKQLTNNVVMQGSGTTPWLWHWFTKNPTDDYAAIYPKQYLDLYKLGYVYYTLLYPSMLPAELGWYGILDYTPGQPATTPDEIENYGNRMVGLRIPIGLETTTTTLSGNGRATELLNVFSSYQSILNSNTMPSSIANQLTNGEWHLVTTNGYTQFYPITYNTHYTNTTSAISVTNNFASQPINLRLKSAYSLTTTGDAKSIVLLSSAVPIRLAIPQPGDKMPGLAVGKIDYTLAPASQVSIFNTGSGTNVTGTASAGVVNLITNRALAVTLIVDSSVPVSGAWSTLCIQLYDSSSASYRNYDIDLNFTGQQTIIIPESTASRMLAEFWPSASNYLFKQQLYTFDFASVSALYVRWQRTNSNVSPIVRLANVIALNEYNTSMVNPTVTANGNTLTFSGTYTNDTYIEYWSTNNVANVYSPAGTLLNSFTPTGTVPTINNGINTVTVGADNTCNIKLTDIFTGTPISW